MWLLVCLSVHAEDLTLHDALLRAMSANLEMRQERLAAERATLYVSQARAAFEPSIGASSHLSGSDPDASRLLDTSVSLGQTLPTGGSASLSLDTDLVADTGHGAGVSFSLWHPLLDGAGPWTALATLRAAHRARDYEALTLRARAESLALSVSAAYWGLAAARETLVLARRSQEIAEQQLADMRERKEQGFAALGDVLQVERAVGVARQTVVVAEADVESSQAGLSRLMGVRLEDRTPLVPVDRPQVPGGALDLPSATERARLFNAAYLQQRLLLEEARDLLRLAHNGALPALDLSASLGRTGSGASASDALSAIKSGGTTTWNLGLTFHSPITGRADRRSARRAELAVDQARLALDAADQDLLLEVEAAVREVRRDRARLDLARQTVLVAQAALEADQELLNAGRGSSREVVRSLEALDAAHVSRLQAEIDLQASHLGLLKVEGLLLDALGIPAP
ncbi:MAG: TolC family protein [Deltaproteobacteria bacterium]|nr:TolC family protein [Deltaproteobacteria bacterium]